MSIRVSFNDIKMCLTRLISIVSKPIIIVVVLVVIDVVFVKKKLGPKKFWLKKSMSKKLYAKIILGKKN